MRPCLVFSFSDTCIFSKLDYFEISKEKKKFVEEESNDFTSLEDRKKMMILPRCEDRALEEIESLIML